MSCIFHMWPNDRPCPVCADINIIDRLRAERDNLFSDLCSVSDELNDPMGQYWCDEPKEDRRLLESLRDRVDKIIDREGMGAAANEK